MTEKILPTTLEEAIEMLKSLMAQDLEEIKASSEKEFLAITHHSAGRAIRNEWFLWWQPNHNYPDQWPAEKPKLNEMFNSHGITHADDMSGIIFTSFHRSLLGKDIEFEAQVQHYKDYWEKHNGNTNQKS